MKPEKVKYFVVSVHVLEYVGTPGPKLYSCQACFSAFETLPFLKSVTMSEVCKSVQFDSKLLRNAVDGFEFISTDLYLVYISFGRSPITRNTLQDTHTT